MPAPAETWENLATHETSRYQKKEQVAVNNIEAGIVSKCVADFMWFGLVAQYLCRPESCESIPLSFLHSYQLKAPRLPSGALHEVVREPQQR